MREAIDSAVSQTFSDIEILVGDDSGDLEDVVREVDDSRVRYIRNERRLGMAGNYTALLDRADGELVGILDDDDQLLPTFVERVVSAFDADPSLGVVFTNHYFSKDGELRLRQSRLPGGKYENFLRPLLEHRPVPCSAALMQRAVWEDVRPLPDLITADLVLQIRAAEAGWPFFYVNEPLMSYRIDGTGVTAGDSRFREQAAAAWELFEFHDPYCEELRRRKLAGALVSLAAHHLKVGAYSEARATAHRANEVTPRPLGPRARLIVALTRHEWAVPIVVWLHRGARALARLARRVR